MNRTKRIEKVALQSLMLVCSFVLFSCKSLKTTIISPSSKGLQETTIVDKGIGGEVYHGGVFQTNHDFPYLGHVADSENEQNSSFIERIDENGQRSWSCSLKGSGRTILTDVHVGDKDLVVVGYFTEEMTIYGVGDTVKLFARDNEDVFLLKFDLNGRLLWSKTLLGTNSERMFNVERDSSGNIFTSGFFRVNLDVDPGPDEKRINAFDKRDLIVEKFDPDGNFVWVHTLGNFCYEVVMDMTLDVQGNVLVTGHTDEQSPYENRDKSAVFPSNGLFDVIVEKLNGDGVVLWQKTIGSEGIDWGRSLVVLPNGNSIVAGVFEGEVDFDPGEDEYFLKSQNGSTIFLLCLDEYGNFVWARKLNGSCSEIVVELETMENGNLLLTGVFNEKLQLEIEGEARVLETHEQLGTFLIEFNIEGEVKRCAQLDAFWCNEATVVGEDLLLGGRDLKTGNLKFFHGNLQKMLRQFNVN